MKNTAVGLKNVYYHLMPIATFRGILGKEYSEFANKRE
jgi:hypothetical protein